MNTMPRIIKPVMNKRDGGRDHDHRDHDRDHDHEHRDHDRSRHHRDDCWNWCW
jgi:hypothetical protein